MRACEFCGAENTDATKHCTACNEPMTAADAAEDVKTTEVVHHKELVRKEIVYGVISVALVAALVVAVARNQKKKALQNEVRHYYTEFIGQDEAHVPQFWKCMGRGDKVPKDNLELEQFLESAVVKSKGGYAKYARSRCMPLLVGAPSAMDMTTPPFLAGTHEKYVAALRVLKTDADTYINTIAGIEANTDPDEALKKLAANYHYAGGESAQTFAYDKFLRCAVPNFAGVKEEQDVLQYLSVALNDPITHVQRWRKDCYPIVAKADTQTVDPDYKTKVAALSADDRDVQAFQDVIKADVDKERKAAHDPFEKAWFRFAEVRDAHMAAIGSYLAD